MKRFLIGIIIGAGLLIHCDGNRPTEPEPAKDYVAWFVSYDIPYRYYGYHPTSGQIDSFRLDIDPYRGIEISADGRLLFAAQRSRTYVITLAEQRVTDTIPFGGEPVVSADGRLIALQGEHLEILNVSDYSLVFQDSIASHGGTFSQDGSTFYCVEEQQTVPENWVVYWVNLDNNAVARVDPMVAPRDIRVSQDESTWFLRDGAGLAVYDVLSDTLVFRRRRCGVSGGITLTADESKVIYSKHSNWQFECLPPYTLGCYEPTTGGFSGIRFEPECYQHQPYYASSRAICSTPDSRYAVGVGGDYPGYVFCFDLSDMSFRADACLGTGLVFRMIACQKGL